MSAPYWGQLPPSKACRMSADYDQTDRRQSLDQSAAPSESQTYSHSRSQSQSQPQSRSNRASVQTTHTDTNTDSTFSPLQSPIASNFQGNGLAPRPPSLPYGQNQYPAESNGKRARRTSRAQEDLFFDEITASPSPLPAAPDVPRGPPISYKDPYRNSSPAFTPTYTYNADGSPGPPLSAYRFSSPRYGSPLARVAAMDSESFYKDDTPEVERISRAPVLDRSRQTFDESGGTSKPPVHRGLEGSRSIGQPPADGDATEKETVDPSAPKRQGTLSAPVKRPTWADDRSPLQRLELTLDSITKEEKRARVEAAEHRARERAERAARKESISIQERLQLPPERQTNQPIRTRDRRQSNARPEDQRAIVADPVPTQPTVVVSRGPSTRSAQEEARRSSDQYPSSQIPVARNLNITAAEKAEITQGNLSFRERAAKIDTNPPRDVESNSPTSPITPVSGGFSLTRSGSNKLKKNPPGDPWYSARREAEERSAAQYRRNLPREGPNAVPRDAGVPLEAIKPRNEMGTRMPTSPEYNERPPARGKQFNQDDYEEPTVQPKGPAAAAGGLNRSQSMKNNQNPLPSQHPYQTRIRDSEDSPTPVRNVVKSVTFPDRKHEAQMFEGDDYDSDMSDHKLGLHDYMYRGKLKPGRGMYQPPKYLEEWKKATVGTLAGPLLDLHEEPNLVADKSMPWWESPPSSKRRGSTTTRPQLEAREEPYDDTKGQTGFRPALYLKCGPLLRYCGLRYEKPLARANRNDETSEQEIWRGSVMIVTQDSESSYDIPPILRLFVQPIELLPLPPAELRGGQTLPPEYVDPIAGIPKLGRRGETLYVRPVEHLEEAKDASRLDPDDGLFEITRTAPDFSNGPDPPGSFASRKRRNQVDGEKLGKYKDVRGFRLHAERGHTFWRFNIEVELRHYQQRIAYRINHGPAMGFWVPPRGESMNIMFHSCNGFSLSVNPDDFSGPDPLWRDVLNNHQTRPFHIMIGGGDQLYNDAIMRESPHFHNWLDIKNPLHKNNAPLIPELQDEMERFYLNRYMMWFSQGLFGLANCQIPMVNIYDDHDIIDGFGSYPHHFMKSPVFSGLGNVAFKYYMLFQHQSVPDETEETEPSWVLGVKPGPYIHELSRSTFMFLGSKIALLAVDCRTERTRDDVLRENTWKKLMDRCYDEIVKGKTQHLLVLLGVPIAYPRLVWLENILTSRLMDPIKALGKTGMLGNFLNRFDGGVEVLDDLDDHWTAKTHKDERQVVIEDLQDLAADKSVRITILSGDVHLAAIGQFYSNPKQELAKHHDFRYMPNVISSAIANAPPPDIMADILNKRNKIHHFDKDTEEDMIPIFTTGVDGKPRNNKRLLPHRNWCSIREYVPGQTPPSTPPPDDYEMTPEGTPRGSLGSLLRRFSSKRKGFVLRKEKPRDHADRSRPPVSGSGFLRSLSRRGSTSGGGSRPGGLLRTLSLGRGDSSRPRGNGNGGFSRRRNSFDRPDDGGINGAWGPDSEDDDVESVLYEAPRPQRARATTVTAAGPARAAVYASEYYAGGGGGGGGSSSNPNMGRMRGGGAGRNDEYEVGDEALFTAKSPRRAYTQPTRGEHGGFGHNDNNNYSAYYDDEDDEDGGDNRPGTQWNAPPPRPHRRAPTGLTAKYEVDVRGGLDVCLNVEVNPRDPAGITVPYRLLVPRLWYEYRGEEGGESQTEVGYGYEGQGHGQGQGQTQQRTMYEDIIGDEEYEVQEERPQKGVLKRLFSGRGSQYRARRGSS
ncbi:uncharacterized protein F4812DRAFT_463157 [Daldinia caldariorum]|uniref:uncharacterized protein n=1 Tax=Daldinia caldariorum TaxID=326644 RepID=UPI0020084C24|nr:uncharacterized protein F4812DRAFT_463157 [Daldinia caldariorum]KAI1464098.1 hypothetical protein F4812DRAFT_463157 [Daldinia caldariorum]